MWPAIAWITLPTASFMPLPISRWRLGWRPKTATPVDEETTRGLLKLLETLEDSDDVQNVYANFEAGEDVLERLSA